MLLSCVPPRPWRVQELARAFHRLLALIAQGRAHVALAEAAQHVSAKDEETAALVAAVRLLTAGDGDEDDVPAAIAERCIAALAKVCVTGAARAAWWLRLL